MSRFNRIIFISLLSASIFAPMRIGFQSRAVKAAPDITPIEVIKICKPPVPVCLPEYMLDPNTCRCVPRP
jgi:hypothetical protein